MKKKTKKKQVAIKHDQAKNRLDLLPFDSINEIAKILTFGAQKYSDRNWENGFNWGRVYAALQRHLNLWFMGEDLDEETNLSHLAHAGCDLLFLLTFVLRDIGEDDRPKLAKELIAKMKDMSVVHKNK